MNRFRACGLVHLLPLLQVEGCRFYSLQKGAPRVDLKNFSTEAADIFDLDESLVDLASTASAIDELDLVITTDTSVPHLAGTIGARSWVLLHRPSDWRWTANGESTPWYPKLKLFSPGENLRLETDVGKSENGIDPVRRVTEEVKELGKSVSRNRIDQASSSVRNKIMEPQEFGPLLPLTENNHILRANVHPPDWVNPVPTGKYNLVVVGAGTAGLVAASIAAGLGGKVALIEKELMGGDCLNVGCVPSKAIIASAHIAAEIRDASEKGIDVVENGVNIDFPKVMERMRKLRAGISPHDSVERFSGLEDRRFFWDEAFSPDRGRSKWKAPS